MLKPYKGTISLVPSVIKSFPAQLHGFLITFTGRIAGQDGKTKFTIENASRTRIVLADTYVLPPLSSLFLRPPNLILPPEKYTSLVRFKTSRSLETPSYLSSLDHHQERYTPACAQSAVECVSVRCSSSDPWSGHPIPLYHTSVLSSRACFCLYVVDCGYTIAGQSSATMR